MYGGNYLLDAGTFPPIRPPAGGASPRARTSSANGRLRLRKVAPLVSRWVPLDFCQRTCLSIGEKMPLGG